MERDDWKNLGMEKTSNEADSTIKSQSTTNS